MGEQYPDSLMESAGYLLYLHGAFISWGVASLLYCSLNHTSYHILKQLWIPKKKRALVMRICQLWFSERITRTRDQLLACFRPLVIITYCCVLLKEDWRAGTSESGCHLRPPSLATYFPRYPWPSSGPSTRHRKGK